MKVTAVPVSMVYFHAVRVVNNSRGLFCRSATSFSLDDLLLRKCSSSSAFKAKKAASVAEAREVRKISTTARRKYSTPGVRAINRKV